MLLARGLRSRGAEVAVVGPPGASWLQSSAMASDIEFIPVHFRPGHVLAGSRLLRRSMKNFAPDLVHAHMFGMGLLAALANVPAVSPLVITLHGGGGELVGWKRRLALSYAMLAADNVVAVSEALRDELQRQVPFQPREIRVIYNGVPQSQTLSDGAADAYAALVAKGKSVVAVGNHLPVKGHLVLINAMARCKNRDWHLSIAGRRTEHTDDLLREIQKFGLADRVSLLGSIPEPMSLLRTADLFVMPSHSEAMPMALLEAMSAGVPCVATRVGGIPEALDGLGTLVPPNNPVELSIAIDRALSRPEDENRSAGVALVTRVRTKFGVDLMSEAYELLFNETLSKSR
ncbi:glycosyltransferase [Gemmatimonas groenlandica]|uniref:Glycosyltransferase n=2 Tax=Gemmatimonas groenlandica TaxID=2732249 RepID=A0A6M4IRR9_9BACT|nr:glycosyltransferase [Gemmatimonas groenlandica]